MNINAKSNQGAPVLGGQKMATKKRKSRPRSLIWWRRSPQVASLRPSWRRQAARGPDRNLSRWRAGKRNNFTGRNRLPRTKSTGARDDGRRWVSRNGAAHHHHRRHGPAKQLTGCGRPRSRRAAPIGRRVARLLHPVAASALGAGPAIWHKMNYDNKPAKRHASRGRRLHGGRIRLGAIAALSSARL